MGLSGPGLAIVNGMLYFNIKMKKNCASVICLHVAVAAFISNTPNPILFLKLNAIFSLYMYFSMHKFVIKVVWRLNVTLIRQLS